MSTPKSECECVENCPHTELLVSLENAFPDGTEAHREYHQALIDAAKAQKKFWEDLSIDLKKNGIKAVLLVVIGLIVAKLFGPDAVKALLKIAL